MRIFYKKTYILSSVLLTVATVIITAFLFSCVFCLFPVKQEWLIIASELSLAISVFFGSFYFSSRQFPLQISKLLLFVIILILLFLLLSVSCGDLNPEVFIRKLIFIIIAAFCGFIFGK